MRVRTKKLTIKNKVNATKKPLFDSVDSSKMPLLKRRKCRAHKKSRKDLHVLCLRSFFLGALR